MMRDEYEISIIRSAKSWRIALMELRFLSPQPLM